MFVSVYHAHTAGPRARLHLIGASQRVVKEKMGGNRQSAGALQIKVSEKAHNLPPGAANQPPDQ